MRNCFLKYMQISTYINLQMCNCQVYLHLTNINELSKQNQYTHGRLGINIVNKTSSKEKEENDKQS